MIERFAPANSGGSTSGPRTYGSSRPAAWMVFSVTDPDNWDPSTPAGCAEARRILGVVAAQLNANADEITQHGSAAARPSKNFVLIVR